MKTAVYARVSTQDKGQNVQVQLDQLREYCGRRGWTITKEYIDNGVSGAKTDRPALNQLMADARKRKFDCLAVYKFDRFGRSLPHLVLSLAEFQSLGVSFCSITDGVDLSTAVGKLQFGILASIAEFERSLIAERTKSGIAYARKQGKHIGRPTCKVTGSDVRELLGQGMAKPEIAAKLGISLKSVYNLLAA